MRDARGNEILTNAADDLLLRSDRLSGIASGRSETQKAGSTDFYTAHLDRLFSYAPRPQEAVGKFFRHEMR